MQCLIYNNTLFIPRIFKNVSCCPAKDAFGRSSDIAELLIATSMLSMLSILSMLSTPSTPSTPSIPLTLLLYFLHNCL